MRLVGLPNGYSINPDHIAWTTWKPDAPKFTIWFRPGESVSFEGPGATVAHAAIVAAAEPHVEPMAKACEPINAHLDAITKMDAADPAWTESGFEARQAAAKFAAPVEAAAGDALPEGWTRSPLGELKHDSGYRIREGDAEFIVIDPRGFHVIRGRWPEEAALDAAQALIREHQAAQALIAEDVDHILKAEDVAPAEPKLEAADPGPSADVTPAELMPSAVRELADQIVDVLWCSSHYGRDEQRAILDRTNEIQREGESANPAFQARVEWVAIRIAEHVEDKTRHLRAENAELANQWEQIGHERDATVQEISRLKADLGNSQIQARWHAGRADELKADLTRLRAAVEPFVKVVAGIPDNWPGRCVLTFDDRTDGYHLNYLAEHRRPIYPTIGEWRRLAEAVEGKATGPSSVGAEMIRQERQRQWEIEDYADEHDDEHTDGQLLTAALCYAHVAARPFKGRSPEWPWTYDSWKPAADPIRNLTKAGALIAAEIDRLRRKEADVPSEAVTAPPSSRRFRWRDPGGDVLVGRYYPDGDRYEFDDGSKLRVVRESDVEWIDPEPAKVVEAKT